jgi:hypothetical protein
VWARVQDLGLRAQGLVGFRVKGSRFEVNSLGFRV